MKQSRNILIAAGGIIIAAILSAADLLHGITDADSAIIWMLRLPRMTTAILTGAALALAGAQMQSILRNPLADPHIMGVSSGAAAGALGAAAPKVSSTPNAAQAGITAIPAITAIRVSAIGMIREFFCRSSVLPR